MSVDHIYTRREELVHALTHGLGLGLSVAGTVLLVVFAAQRGDPWHVVACSIFGTSLILLYASSTLYHGLPPSRAKRFFGLMDHAAIYVLIAGTYTPFVLVCLRGPLGWTMAGLVWGLATLGVVAEFVSKGRLRKPALFAYLLMGWLIVIAIVPLIRAVPTGGLMLLMAGGLAYTVGTIFFVWRGLPYHHAVWHVFVLAGSVCHFFSVLLYVIPDMT